jgi:hypothetical protein
MFKQEVRSQDLDDIVDKVHALIVNEGEWAVELHQDKFVKKSCCDRCCVALQHFGLHPFGSVISYH